MGRTAHPPELKQRALDLYVDHGAKHAAAQLGLRADLIRAWASRAGLSRSRAEKVAAAVEGHKVTAQQRTLERTQKFEQLVDDGLDVTLKRIHDPDARLSEVVGAWTRAVHDLALLTGGATERHEQVDGVDAEIRRLLDRLPRATPQPQQEVSS